MWIKKFLLDDRRIESDSFLWNMIGSIIMAFQSVIMLMILTRTLGLQEAGIFTIAYANANLFLTIGKYGMRYFQVSDVKNQFTFSEYLTSRIITSVAMLLVSFSYVGISAVQGGYTFEKMQVILWMCIFKAVDAMEDIYHGLYQKENRLDIASKAMTLRMGITIIVFGCGLVILKDLLISLIISTLLTVILLLIFTKWTCTPFHAELLRAEINKRQIIALLKVCFPLFLGAFLSFYIGNAPKYAIDSMLNDELQACYGFISMPVFVIGLLNGFIFNPMLYQMSVLWNQRHLKRFVFKTVIQTGIVALITLACLVGAYLLGIPVLSLIYNTDLSPYKMELLVLLLGGGFLGISGLLNAVITIIRGQKWMLWGYVFVAVLAYLFSDQIVGTYGMLGASVLYTVLMGILCVIFAGIFVCGIIRKKK